MVVLVLFLGLLVVFWVGVVFFFFLFLWFFFFFLVVFWGGGLVFCVCFFFCWVVFWGGWFFAMRIDLPLWVLLFVCDHLVPFLLGLLGGSLFDHRDFS